ncbi:hypothetical protein, partial [Nonomuraea sp. LPB2021202275-12-8]|uniref:hypothetical protein n=1 Tax=Nonomuraea sp. LPB2021202275-12-8 TaxID=3120159 RepID=UPI00300C3949
RAGVMRRAAPRNPFTLLIGSADEAFPDRLFPARARGCWLEANKFDCRRRQSCGGRPPASTGPEDRSRADID